MKQIKLEFETFTTLFAYEFFFMNGENVLVMTDECDDGPYMSLTNACPQVVDFFNSSRFETQSIDKIIYRDSDGYWTKVQTKGKKFTGYQTLRGSDISTTNYEAAQLAIYSEVH